MACQHALGELVEGLPEPFKALWSHAPLGLRRDRMFLRFLRADARLRGNGL